MTTRIAVVAVMLTLSVVAPAQSDPNFPTPPKGLKSPFRWALLAIGGWNTMLQPWLSYEADVIKTIAKTNFDVLTLEEVWTEAAKDHIVSHPVVKAKYPYYYYAPAQQEGGSCDNSVTPTSFQEHYIDCLIATGANTQTLEQPVVPIDLQCQFDGLTVALTDQRCFACLVNTMQSLPSSTSPLNAIDICADGQGVQYSHGGSPGRLILSRRPLKDVTVVYYDTHLIRRVNIFATISGVRFGFAHWPKNYLEDIDPSLAPFQTGALQKQLAQDMINQSPDVIVGDFNSGPNYQPEAHNLLLQNGYHPLFSRPTYCPAPTHASFPPCQVAELYFNEPGPLAIDNIYIKKKAGLCLWEAFAQKPVSDHIGVSAYCVLEVK